MYGISDSSFLSAAASLQSPDFTLPSLFPAYSQLAGSEMDSVHDSLGLLNSEVSYSGSSGGCSSYGSPSGAGSVSSDSLRKNGLSERLSFRVAGFFDSEGPVRRVYSAGDLQGTAESPLWSESSMIIEGMTKACPYSPEQKRERIERYRTKRNLRNFTKKIKYECRKTLADSRRRIRGRFARNEGENYEINNSKCWSTTTEYPTAEEQDFTDDSSWITFLHSSSPNLLP